MRCAYWTVVFWFAAALALGYAVRTLDAGFVETGECENNQMCVYKYRAMQEDFDDEMKLDTSVTTTVVLSCDAVGEYAKQTATRHCLTFTNTTILFSGSQDESVDSGNGAGDDSEIPVESADRLLSGWFCFIQTDGGKVVAVYHSTDDKPDIVNFKKSVAASFQSNFKQTEEEEEDDPQSKHMSHYSYDRKDDIVVVHRNFATEDIVEYPSQFPRDDVELKKDEYLTYRSGILEHTTGSVNVKVMPLRAKVTPSKRDTTEPDGQETFDGSFSANRFSVTGSYSLDIEYCYNIPRAAARKRRETKEKMMRGHTQSTLSAHHNQTAASFHRMQQLRQDITSVQKSLLTLHQTPTDSKLVNSLQHLLQLESRYGSLPGYTPALYDVLEYLQKIFESQHSDDLRMRLIIYSLLSAEGSHDSQAALLDSLVKLNDEKERNTLITIVAFLQNASSDFVSQLEKIIDPDPQSTDPLLLAYGAIASSASSEIQQQVVRFLRSRLDTAGDNLVAVVHLIHSLSNTGCNTTVKIFIGYVSHRDRSVQLAAIDALRMHTTSELVQTTFIRMLSQPGVTEDLIEAIIQALTFGLEHQQFRGFKRADSAILLTALASAAVELNNPDLQQLLIGYLSNLNTDDSNQRLGTLQARVTESKMQNNDTYMRNRRGTDWDESYSPYDLVASYSSRHSDVITYPYHRAYIWGKYLGVSDLNCQVAAGGFVGVDNDGSHFKLFGKAVAQGHAFGRSATALHAELLVEKENTNWHVKVYAKILWHVLVNEDQRYSLDWNYDWPLYNSARYTIIEFEYPIFIFVGILRFSVGVYSELGVSANVQASVDVVSSASAAIIPKVTLTASASATASLLELIRGGIRVSASISYQLEPRTTTRVCIPQLRVQNCLTVYEEWPTSYVDIYAYYQHRTIEWCSGWLGIPYPCGFPWGSEHRWNAASVRWDLYGSSKRSIYSACDANLPSCYIVY